MRRIAVVALLSVISLSHLATVRAQTLYKCASANGNIYQQIPCPRSARLVRTMETVPDPPPTAAQLTEQALKSKRDREESAFLSHLAGTDRTGSGYRSVYRSDNARRSGSRLAGGQDFFGSRMRRTSGSACAAAKSARDNAIRTAGLHRTFELLSRLDADVFDACKQG